MTTALQKPWKKYNHVNWFYHQIHCKCYLLVSYKSSLKINIQTKVATTTLGWYYRLKVLYFNSLTLIRSSSEDQNYWAPPAIDLFLWIRNKHAKRIIKAEIASIIFSKQSSPCANACCLLVCLLNNAHKWWRLERYADWQAEIVHVLDLKNMRYSL